MSVTWSPSRSGTTSVDSASFPVISGGGAASLALPAATTIKKVGKVSQPIQRGRTMEGKRATAFAEHSRRRHHKVSMAAARGFVLPRAGLLVQPPSKIDLSLTAFPWSVLKVKEGDGSVDRPPSLVSESGVVV